MDKTADPCTDFYQYACGAWNKKHVIPEDRTSISTFEVMADELQVILKDILEKEVDDLDNDSTRKAKHFYQACMNLSQIEIIDDEPLREVIETLGGWPVATPGWDENNESVPSLEKLLAMLKRKFTLGVLLEEWIGPDDKHSEDNVIQIDQPTLGLPSRDYYLHPESQRDLQVYFEYMTDVAVILGANRSDAESQLWDVVEFEIKLANISVPEVHRIDTGAIYTKTKIEQLQKWVPQIKWQEYFMHLMHPHAINASEKIVSYSTPYFLRIGEIIESVDKRVLHNYVLWKYMLDLMPHLPSKFQKARTKFRAVLLGVLIDRNRWSRCVEWTNKKLGMAVGSLYIRDHFKHDSKETALEMIHDIRHAFNDLLHENLWMDKETRIVAEDKANNMRENIGYPEYITNTTRLVEEYKHKVASRRFFDTSLTPKCRSRCQIKECYN